MSTLKAYNFYYFFGKEHIYYFLTSIDVVYQIEFKSFPYLFDKSEPFSSDTFELIISIYFNPSPILPGLDPNIGPTLAEIFDDFYFRSSHSITIYICDTSDGREFARMRIFNYWFYRFHKNIYFKAEAFLLDKDGEEAPVSIIIRRDNPYKYQILEAFEKLTDGYNQK